MSQKFFGIICKLLKKAKFMVKIKMNKN